VRLLSADDLAGQYQRPNYPGTTGDTHPNWRRRLPMTVDELVARIGSVISRDLSAPND
jgi:4-alpha-glucanotransferase